MIVGLGQAGRPAVFCRLLVAFSSTLSLAHAASTAAAAAAAAPPPSPATAPATRPATSPGEEERFRRGDALRRLLADLVEQAGQADGVWPERLPLTRPSDAGAGAVPGL